MTDIRFETLESGRAGGGWRPQRRTVLLALALVAVLAAGAGTVLLWPEPPPPPPIATTIAPGAQLSPAVLGLGYAGPVGGSLDRDAAAIGAIRRRVSDLAARGEAPQDPGSLTVRPADVVVLWAGDRDGERVAVTGFETDQAFTLTLLTGRAGQNPADLVFGETTVEAGADDGTAAPILATDSGGLAFVVAPKAHDVQVMTDQRFLPGGEVVPAWRPLTKEGQAAWAGSLSPAERAIGGFQVDGDGAFRQQIVDQDGTAVCAQLRPIAEPGTDPGGLEQTCQSLQGLGPSGRERGVFAGTASVSAAELDRTGGGTGAARRAAASVGVLRSPENGYLIGWSLTLESEGGSIGTSDSSTATGPATSPGALMEARMLESGDGGDREPYVVLAPEGAVRVRSGSVSVPVKHRIALLFTAPPEVDSTGVFPPVRFEALDGHGRVLARTKI